MSRIKSNLISDPYGLTFLIFALAILPGAAVTQLVLFVPGISLDTTAAAAVSEPISTKFLPALLVLYIARNNRETFNSIHTNPALFGSLGGFAIGISERLLYFTNGSPPTIFWTISVALHTIWGLMVAGTVFWRGAGPWNMLDFLVLLVALLATMALHVLWNVVLI